MLVGKGEGKVIEDLRMWLPLVGIYWCKYQTLVDTFFTQTKIRKLDKIFLFILSTIIYFGNIPVCSPQKGNIKISSGTIPCWPQNNY